MYRHIFSALVHPAKSEAFASLCFNFGMFLCWFSVFRRAGCHRGSLSGYPPPPGGPPSGGPPWSLPKGMSFPWLSPGSGLVSGLLSGWLSINGFDFGSFPLAGVDGSPFGFCKASSSVCSGMLVSRVIVCVAIFLGVGDRSLVGAFFGVHPPWVSYWGVSWCSGSRIKTLGVFGFFPRRLLNPNPNSLI